MKIVSSPKEMQELALELRGHGERISFVPTMGALHEGHLSLLHEGKKHADKLVISIYLNPTQFGPNEDLSKYPKPLEKDLLLAKEAGADIVFTPNDNSMYPKGFQTFVEVSDLTKGLCGASRPGHFKGVTTVVQKLFNIVQPSFAIFGEKDYQQLVTIRTMVKDLNIPIEIIGSPIVREHDGLAMSSRNAYLSSEERKAATFLSKAIFSAQKAAKEGASDASELLMAAKSVINGQKLLKIDYIKLCDAETLVEVKKVEGPSRLIAAVFCGKTRLIDNCSI